MKNFQRNNLLFSLCGLSCSLQHGNVEYCFQCENYPCEKYDNIDEFDSFITHRPFYQHFRRSVCYSNSACSPISLTIFV